MVGARRRPHRRPGGTPRVPGDPGRHPRGPAPPDRPRRGGDRVARRRGRRRAARWPDGTAGPHPPRPRPAQPRRLHAGRGDLPGFGGGEFDAAARYWLSDFDYLNGRFATALASLHEQPVRGPEDEGERLRLTGHIWRVNARFEEATSVYHEAIDLARREGLAAAEAKALANLAQTACWSGDTAAVADAAGRARELLDLVPNPVELVKLRSAEAVAHAMAGAADAARSAVGDTRHLADGIAYRGGHNLADVAEILLGVLAGDHEGARRTRSELDARTRTSGGNTYWVPIATSWIDGSPQPRSTCLPSAGWTAPSRRWAAGQRWWHVDDAPRPHTSAESSAESRVR